MASSPFSKIRRLTEFVERTAAEIAVLAVINVKSQTRQLPDYSHHSMRSSFLNDLEIDSVIGAFRECGFYTRHFADEQDFFSWVLGGGTNSLGIARQLVYTSAMNGSGPGRRALVPAFCAHFSIPTMNSDAYSCSINRQNSTFRDSCRVLESLFPVRGISFRARDGGITPSRALARGL